MFLLIVSAVHADRILLVPLDSRPAAGQFAQMIGKIDGVDVRMPPYELLGRFTTQGSPERILDWLEDEDVSDVSALVVSTDMICYGGLIASRVFEVSTVAATRRLQRLIDIKRRNPKIKMYLFSSTMRLTPTETRKASNIRLKLARYEELRDLNSRTVNPDARGEMEGLHKLIPQDEIDQYEATRARDHAIQRQLIKMAKDDAVDFLIIGQDDARQYGPHVMETTDLRNYVRQLDLDYKVYFCEGVDQHSSVLLSRALLKRSDFTPRVRVIYSDENGKSQFASYESIKVEDSLAGQLLASGARPVTGNGESDYTLYLNTPGRRTEPFRAFVDKLKTSLDLNQPVAVADINLAPDGTADPALFSALWEHGRLMNLLSYAGWNTAGNTIGTAIPAANVYLLARQSKVDPLVREVAQREFLIHRFVNDYDYHKFTRPTAYSLISRDHHEEIYGDEWDEVNTFVARDLQKHLHEFFDQGCMNHTFMVGAQAYRYIAMTGAKVWLPWPRPYEVRLEFHLQVAPAQVSSVSATKKLSESVR